MKKKLLHYNPINIGNDNFLFAGTEFRINEITHILSHAHACTQPTWANQCTNRLPRAEEEPGA